LADFNILNHDVYYITPKLEKAFKCGHGHKMKKLSGVNVEQSI